MGQADVSSKRILAGDPTLWIRWLLQDPTADVKAHLSGEFQFIQRYSDEIFQVQGQMGHFILAVEVQLHTDKRMPRRMRAYAALAEEKYELPVYPVVFYLLPPRTGVVPPDAYHSQFMGLTAHQDFHVVPVWKLNAQQVLEEGIVAFVPFIPLMQQGDANAILESVKLLRERGIEQEAETVLALFASFVMKPEQIKKLMRWNMAILRESPWYNQILQEGLEQGVQQGLEQGVQQGLEQGKLEGRRQDILYLLRARFNPPEPRVLAISKRLNALTDMDRLRNLLVEAAQAPSLEAFEKHLGLTHEVVV